MPDEMPVTETATPPPDGTVWMPPSPEELNRLLPQYRIESLLGQGGMGAVYKGFQPELDRPVAIKLLPVEASADAAFVAKFKHEARTLAKLHHSRIITIHDLGQTSAGHLFFVMEYLDGSNLRTVLTESGLSQEQALMLVGQICDALDAAHQQGIVHRDIKPENILLTHDGYVKLIDFGLASAQAGEVIFGTPGYAAPEVHAGQADHRADIYALGVVLYEMLTGEMPATPYEPAARKAKTDPRIDHVLRRALQADPGQRFQHASELKAAVEHVRTTPSAPAPRPVPARVTRAIPHAAPTAAKLPRPVVAKRPRTPLKTFLFIAMDLLLIAFSIWWLWSRFHHREGKAAPHAAQPAAKPLPAANAGSPLPPPPPKVSRQKDDPIIGRWFWRGDLVVSFSADGSFSRSDAGNGSWTCDKTSELERVYTLKWKTGKVDVMTLKAGSVVLSGKRTNTGEEISAYREARADLPGPPLQKAAEAGFTPLLDSGHQEGWKESGPGEMREKDGVFTLITPEGARGLYCYTARQFSDLVLRFDFAVEAWSANSGVYLRLPALGNETPPLAMATSYEVEIAGEQTGAIPFHKPQPDLAPPLKLGEWNECEVTVTGQDYKVKLNGVLINQFTGSGAVTGYLALQNMSGPAAVHFSNVRIKDLSPTAAVAPPPAAPLPVVASQIEKKPVRLDTSLPAPIARFSFDGTTVEPGAVIGKGKQHDGILELDASQETYAANPPVGFASPPLKYQAFSVAVRLRPDDLSGGNIPLLVAGKNYRWLSLRMAPSGDLSLCLNNADFKLELSAMKVEPRKWNTLVVACDLTARKVTVMVNGSSPRLVKLPDSFKLAVIGTNAEQTDKTWMFTDYSNAARLSGAIDELLVFNSVLTDAQMARLTRDLNRETFSSPVVPAATPAPLPDIRKARAAFESVRTRFLDDIEKVAANLGSDKTLTGSQRTDVRKALREEGRAYQTTGKIPGAYRLRSVTTAYLAEVPRASDVWFAACDEARDFAKRTGNLDLAEQFEAVKMAVVRRSPMKTPVFPLPPLPAPDAPETAALRDSLMNHSWSYTATGYTPFQVRFQKNGIFHPTLKWHYWVAGPNTIYVQFSDKKYDPDTAETFTFNADLTTFTCVPTATTRIDGRRLAPIAP